MKRALQRRFGRPRRPRNPVSILIMASGLIALVLLVYGAFEILDPFHPIDPLVQEITIGESVIGPWKYGGVDEQGHLRFFNEFQQVVIPANSTTFDAEGDYVIIHDHTPSTLTIEHRTEYASQIGFIIVTFVGGSLAVFILLRARAHLQKSGKPPFYRNPRFLPLQRKVKSITTRLRRR